MTEKDFADPLTAPDTVVLASGSYLSKSDIPGANRDNVFFAHDYRSQHGGIAIAAEYRGISLIRQAGKMTSELFEEVRKLAIPGACEADLAAEIEYRLKRKGAEGVAFESIVASGPKSALPHVRPSSKLLKKNENVWKQ